MKHSSLALGQAPISPLAGEALADALDAHLLLFAGSCARTVRFWPEYWLERWARFRQIEHAALAIMDASPFPSDTFSGGAQLSGFAARHDLNLILGNWPGTDHDPVLALVSRDGGQSPVASHQKPSAAHRGTGIHVDSNNGWGLND